MPRETFDVVVVGAGLAGSVAALRSQEMGKQTLLLDRGDDPAATGNTRFSGGTMHVARRHMRSSPARLTERILEVTGGRAPANLVAAFTANCERAVDWLIDRGVEFEKPHPVDQWKLTFAPARSFEDIHLWRGAGPHRALQTLHQRVRDRGGVVRGSLEALHLLEQDRRGLTVRCRDGGGVRDIYADSIVLADGGFHANPEMLKRHIGAVADRMLLRGAPSATGDALRMAVALGAGVTNMEFFYGHCVHRDALHDRRLWPMPILDSLLPGAVVVNRAGVRILDEGVDGVGVVNALARSEDALESWLILDDHAWQAARVADPPYPMPNPALTVRDARIVISDTVEGIARSAQIDETGLSSSIESYNRAIKAGNVGTLPVHRSGTPRPISEAPLRAIPLSPAVTFTMGGLLVDERCRVLMADGGTPIKNLYAIGNAAGGLQGGGPHGGYVGGLSLAAVSGLLAGEAAGES